ncbi:MAG: ABC transporter ATP-binding protein [Anaerolineales bacterium]|jgi:ABC-2 type transport system ATP-binding protein
MTDGGNALESIRLSRSFGRFCAVRDVSFSIPRGEIFGLLGPNGAGKTTLIRMFSGILPPSGGKAAVLGFDIRLQTEEIKRRIGYMSQRFSLYNDLTPRENINFYADIYSVPRAERGRRVNDLLEMAGLASHSSELTRALSGAWRQRLALACAIVHQPPMLFLDEPTAGVDPVSRREFWELIYAMAGEGVSVLATTHYMDEAEYCNRIGMMFQGELIALSEPDELRRQLPGALYQLDCEPSELAESILRRMPSVLGVSVHGALLHVDIQSEGSKPEIEAALAEAGVSIRRLEPALPSLEDVFIQLVEKQRGKPARAGENP